METKEQLVTSIKEWIKIDNEILEMKNKIKDYTNKKKSLTQELLDVMKKNEIDCFDINGGALMYKKNTVKKPVNAKTLMATLQKYYSEDPTVATNLTKFILDNRDVVVKETIKRKVDK